MGNKNDGYFIENPIITVRQLKRRNRYYWLDSSVLTRKENGFYLKIFNENISILPCENMEQLKNGLESTQGSLEIAGVNVVCSSSFGVEVYEYLQGCKNIDNLMIFCTNRQKGMSLKEHYSKISEVHQQFFTLINHIRFIENERTESIYFLGQNSINRLNRWTINWLTFSQISRQKGKSNFIELLKALYPGNPIAEKYENTFDLSKNESQRDSMVLSWLFQQNLYLQTINNILSKFRDTFSMALIRQPLQDIYNTIRAISTSQKHPQTTAFITMNLNSNQVSQLQKNPSKYIYFSHFLICELDDSINKKYYNDQYKIILKLLPKPDDFYHDIGGFCISKDNHKIIVNLGNPFKITQIDLQKRQFYLETVFIPKQILNMKHELKSLQLHRQFTRHIIKHIPGQLLSSYFNQQLQIFNTHIKKEISILQSTNANLQLYKVNKALEKCKLKVYFHVDEEAELQKKIIMVKKMINQLIDPQKGVFKVKVYFLLIEVNMRSGEMTKFAKCLMRLKQFFQQKPQNFTQQQSLKLRIYRIYCLILTNKLQFQQNSQKLRQLSQTISSKTKQQKQVSDLYFLLMLTTSKCEQLKGNIAKSRQILSNLLELIKIYHGQNSIFYYYYQLKLQLRKREKTSIQIRQKQTKRSKIYSSIQLSQLPKCDPYPINLSQINFSPYQIIDISTL